MLGDGPALHCLPCELCVEDGVGASAESMFIVHRESDGTLSASLRGRPLHGLALPGVFGAVHKLGTNEILLNGQESTAENSGKDVPHSDHTTLCARNNHAAVPCSDSRTSCPPARTATTAAGSIVIWAQSPEFLEHYITDCSAMLDVCSCAASMFHRSSP